MEEEGIMLGVGRVGFWLWWVLASTVGWIMSIPVVGLGAGLGAGRMAGIVGDAPSWAMLGAVYGAMSGPVLAWLLRQ